VRFLARARLRTVRDSAQAVLTIVDDGQPRLSVTNPSIVEPPDSFAVSVSAEDAAGITDLTIHLEGAVRRDTVIQSDYAPRVDWSEASFISRDARLEDSIVILATVRDGFGKVSQARRVLRVTDTTPPGLQVRVDTIHHGGIDELYFPMVFYPGEVVRIHVKATDNHSLARLGFRMLGGGDSIITSAAADSADFEYAVPPGTNTPNAYVEAYAVDSIGRRTFTRVWAVAMDGTFRPVQALSPYEDPLHEYDQQGGYAFDAKRDRLYFTSFTNELQSVSLSPFAEYQRYRYPTQARGVDLTASGDTVVVLLVGRPNLLLLWDAATGPVTVDTIAVTLLGDCDGWDMQVAANGRAFVTGWSPVGCPTVEVDLRTRTQRTRAIPFALRNLVVSGDHSVIVAWNQSEALIYRSATDVISSVKPLFPAPTTAELSSAGPALDHSGATIVIRGRVYDGDLNSSRGLEPDPSFVPPSPALSADGKTVFLGSWPGYVRGNTETGALAERIILPRVPWRMFAHPDGQRMVVFGWRWIGVVDLR